MKKSFEIITNRRIVHLFENGLIGSFGITARSAVFVQSSASLWSDSLNGGGFSAFWA